MSYYLHTVVVIILIMTSAIHRNIILTSRSLKYINSSLVQGEHPTDVNPTGESAQLAPLESRLRLSWESKVPIF